MTASAPRLTYRSISLSILALAVLAALAGDLAVTAFEPLGQLLRFLRQVVRPDFAAVDWRSIVYTVAFAVIGVSIGATAGFGLSVLFPLSAPVRVLCASLRSVHELFWALILIQIFGLTPLAGILAIALPYAGIFGKVYSEIAEEADLSAERVLPKGTSALSSYVYARLPELLSAFKTYTLYRLECGLRSSAVLGFIGLPTLGFHLDSYFRQGNYGAVGALLLTFYLAIASRRLWARLSIWPFVLIGAVLVLPEGVGGFRLANLTRFITEDIVPLPLRQGGFLAADSWAKSGVWLWTLARDALIPGTIATLMLGQMALALTGIIALTVYPLANIRLLGPFGHVLGRALLIVGRSTPEYVVAFILLQMFGPSMLPAVLAIALHNGAIIGYLVGRQADGLPLRADAPTGINLYAFELTPRIYGQFLAYLLYRWEIILRESAILGLLGVATLGYYVDAAISELRFDEAMAIIVWVGLMTLAVDAVSRRLRAALRLSTLPQGA